MLFTRLAFIIAWGGLVFGAMNLALGLYIASLEPEAYAEALRQYTTSTTSGQVIDKAGKLLLYAIAFGTVAEISRTVSR